MKKKESGKLNARWSESDPFLSFGKREARAFKTAGGKRTGAFCPVLGLYSPSKRRSTSQKSYKTKDSGDRRSREDHLNVSGKLLHIASREGAPNPQWRSL